MKKEKKELRKEQAFGNKKRQVLANQKEKKKNDSNL